MSKMAKNMNGGKDLERLKIHLFVVSVLGMGGVEKKCDTSAAANDADGLPPLPCPVAKLVEAEKDLVELDKRSLWWKIRWCCGATLYFQNKELECWKMVTFASVAVGTFILSRMMRGKKNDAK